jgi:hypothetical protein
MILEDLLLLRFRGTVRPVPLRLCDGVPGECRKRELGVVPQVEPPFVTVAVRAGQGHQDVVVTPTLLHLEVGAIDRRRLRTLLQSGEPEEVPEKVPVGNNIEAPLAHSLKHSHLLDAIQVEMLELEPVLKQHPADEPTGRDEEVALV